MNDHRWVVLVEYLDRIARAVESIEGNHGAGGYQGDGTLHGVRHWTIEAWKQHHEVGDDIPF